MSRKKRWVGLTILILLAGGALTYHLHVRSRDEAWHRKFLNRAAQVREHSHPTTYADLGAGLPPVSDGDNGAERLAGIGVSANELDLYGDRGVLRAVRREIPSERAAKVEDRQRTQAFVEAHRPELENLWKQIADVATAATFRAPCPDPEVSWEDPVYDGLRRAGSLLWLQAWSDPALVSRAARTHLTLAEKFHHDGGYRYFLRTDELQRALTLLRRSLERGPVFAEKDLRELREQVGRLADGVLPDLRRMLAYYRVYYIQHANPDREGWSGNSDYDEYGEGWTLYRDLIRGLDTLDIVEREFADEEGVRSVTNLREDPRTWVTGKDAVDSDTDDMDDPNSDGLRSRLTQWPFGLPYIQDIAHDGLKLLTHLRLAAITLDLLIAGRSANSAGSDPGELAAQIAAAAPPDALTGKHFAASVEGDYVYVYVPWRNQDFRNRPGGFYEPFRVGEDGKPVTLRADPLREAGWIWAVPK